VKELKFEAKVEVDHKKPYLKTTDNGSQWSCIGIKNPTWEIPQIIKVLQDYLDKHLNK
jgi:hypothetical protein